MAHGRLLHTWDQVSTIWQVLAESNRDSDKQRESYTVYDIHPFRDKDGRRKDQSVLKEQQDSGRFWSDIGLIASLSGDKSHAISSVMERTRARS